MLAHPDVHSPWSQWSEEQTLHLALVYNNPFRWNTRRLLYNDCYRHLKATPNLRVYRVELAFGDRPFEVTGDDPLDVQLRTDCVLWCKENLIGVAVQRFPPGWRYGGYSDGDFHFTRYDWGLEAIHMLQHHQFVQLFSSYADLTGETATSISGHRPYSMNSSFAWNYLHQREFLDRKKAAQEKIRKTDPYYGLPLPMGARFPFGFPPGAPGGAWAWRRGAFDAVGGMLDVCVVGGADWHMAFGLIEQRPAQREMLCSKSYTDCIKQWQAKAGRLKNHPGRSAIGCIDQFAVHHFHGARSGRAYGTRWQILADAEFNPGADLTKDWQGVWRWSGNKPKLRDAMNRLFIGRNEDDPSLSGRKPLV